MKHASTIFESVRSVHAQAWAKRWPRSGATIRWHALADHSADVAACLESLLDLPVVSSRLAALARRGVIPEIWKQRLCVAAFLHDIGKANSKFQLGEGGHIAEATYPVTHSAMRRASQLEALGDWGVDVRFLLAVTLAHHGAPPELVGSAPDVFARFWQATEEHDPVATVASLVAAARSNWPIAFQPSGERLPPTEGEGGRFWHGFLGLLQLADWLGSDDAEDAFPYANGLAEARLGFARARARTVLRGARIDTTELRAQIAPSLDFAKLWGFMPHAIQRAAAEAPGPVVVLEAETGSGKTEAALWRFARLFQSGRVDGLYFALPTRVAATAMHGRVQRAADALFGAGSIEVVRALPGDVAAGAAKLKVLPEFRVQWTDGADAPARRARWAAEHPKRFLAAPIAVGTIDQALLRAHQRHAWHALLCQLGALACLRGGLSAPPREAEAWRAALRQLAPEHHDDAAFTLVTPADRPGFLQAPIPGGSLAGFSPAATPDALDMLVTSRAHDVKPALMDHAAPEEWLFALLTIQTMEGYSGRDNYGIARMNGGSSNRPAVSLRPPGGIGAHVMRDITRLLALRDEVLANNPHYAPDGLALVWLLPWDGAASLTPDRLDPYFFEICRRVRLVAEQGRMRALTATSKAARIDFGPQAAGLTGDPWTPIDARKGEAKALTIDARGFFYKRLAEILGGKHRGFDLAPLHRVGAEEAEHTAFLLVCRALARGQGKTEGLHERRIPVPPRAVDFWRSGDTAQFAEIAEQRIEQAGKVRGALRRALMVLFQNGPDRVGFQPTDPNSGKRAEPFLDRLESRIDDDFFRSLFQEVEAEQDEARTRLRAAWLTELHKRARGILREAETGAPTSAVRRFRAQARAEAALSGMFFGMFKDYFPKETSDAA